MRKLLALCCLMLLFSQTALASERSDRQNLEAYIASFKGRVGIYAENLKTGKSFKYKDGQIFPTASTSKLIVSLAVYRHLYPTASVGMKNMYDDDIYKMIHSSDNDAFYELLDIVDTKAPGVLKRTIDDLGLKRTKIHNEDAFRQYGYHSITTPKEMAEVFRAIDKGKYLGKAKTDVLKDELANTIFQDEIPRFMQTTVLHKVGELDNVLCDVGIIDDGKDRILMSIYTDASGDTSVKSDMIAYTAAKLYNLLRRY
mgnify:FL=1